jgi:hypothetical protein
MKLSVERQVRIAAPHVAASPIARLENARVAIVHYWFVSRRGGEKVVEAMAAMFPQADLFSLVSIPTQFRTLCVDARSRVLFCRNSPEVVATTGDCFRYTLSRWSSLI